MYGRKLDDKILLWLQMMSPVTDGGVELFGLLFVQQEEVEMWVICS